MSPDEFSPVIPSSFCGMVRLFPLPNVVFFPHVLLPLHIFEPRYCEMLEDALATDRLIAMTLLEPGWEKDYEGRPRIASMACLGRIVSHARLPDGRHNLMLAGVVRAAIAQELPPAKPFRRARVELLDDHYPASGAGRRPLLQRRILDCFERLIPASALAEEQLEQLRSQQLALGMLTDIIAFTISLPLAAKQELLQEWNVDRRAALLLRAMEELLGPPAPEQDFPPGFSAN